MPAPSWVRLAVEELLDAEVVGRFLHVEQAVVLPEEHIGGDLGAETVPCAQVLIDPHLQAGHLLDRTLNTTIYIKI